MQKLLMAILVMLVTVGCSQAITKNPPCHAGEPTCPESDDYPGGG